MKTRGLRHPFRDGSNTLLGLILSLLERLAALSRFQKRAIVMGIDCTSVLLSIWVAYSLRISTWIYWDRAVALLLLVAIPSMLTIFSWAGMYRSIFRYAGTGMMRIIIQAHIAYAAVMASVFMMVGFTGVPRTMGLLQPIILFLFVASSRALFRLLMVDFRIASDAGPERRNILIYGAGVAGQQLAAALSTEAGMRVAGFLDDDLRLDQQKIDGHRIHASTELAAVIADSGATDVLLALPNSSRARRKEIVERLSKFKVGVKILPQARDIVGGHVSVSDVRPVEVEDLLGREAVQPRQDLLRRTIEGKSVLVTGAGGSIGSELCRQILAIGARRLTLLDVSEFALYAIERELRQLARAMGSSCEIAPVLGSVTNRPRMADAFAIAPVDTVFHAAAYKHVPLVEANPVEGIRNNVFGTHHTCEAAERAGVKDFILVSTDKAVRPTNVMGASKRAAEIVIQARNEAYAAMRISMVRFGNVLGSSGSVVPLFRRQIEAGGPITVTHRDVTRYFMTIPEAANLVIQAAGLARGGEVFVLDMGRPMRILDLARTMVSLSGLTVRDEENPLGDIEIAEVGLRPGEKLYEELLIGNQPEATEHPAIYKANESFTSWNNVSSWLEAFAELRDPTDAIASLERLVPEFDHRRDDLAD